MVYPHEAIALFRYLGARIPKEQAQRVRERILENAAQGDNGHQDTGGQGVAKKTACAFLVAGRCSAYEVRPAACAGYHSTSRDRCEASFNAAGSSSDAIPMLKGLHFVATALDEGMDDALRAGSLSGARIELHTALAALMRNPALIERWRAGRELRPVDSRRRGAR
jgi:Fe-S-cluster containining protein